MKFVHFTLLVILFLFVSCSDKSENSQLLLNKVATNPHFVNYIHLQNEVRTLIDKSIIDFPDNMELISKENFDSEEKYFEFAESIGVIGIRVYDQKVTEQFKEMSSFFEDVPEFNNLSPVNQEAIVKEASELIHKDIGLPSDRLLN